MANKVRINLANPMELRELPGIGPAEAELIIRFRAEHGPITGPPQLTTILGSQVAECVLPDVDFAPSEATAPEAPGA
jgi:DNA uptake protein ComE-like DNA-binding protein